MCPWFDSWRYHNKQKAHSREWVFFISKSRRKLAFLREEGIKKELCASTVGAFYLQKRESKATERYKNVRCTFLAKGRAGGLANYDLVK